MYPPPFFIDIATSLPSEVWQWTHNTVVKPTPYHLGYLPGPDAWTTNARWYIWLHWIVLLEPTSSATFQSKRAILAPFPCPGSLLGSRWPAAKVPEFEVPGHLFCHLKHVSWSEELNNQTSGYSVDQFGNVDHHMVIALLTKTGFDPLKSIWRGGLKQLAPHLIHAKKIGYQYQLGPGSRFNTNGCDVQTC